MDETKSESDGGDPGESQDNDDDPAEQPGQQEQGYDEETDESGALSLRVASAAERERLERSRKGNPIKKIIVGNINNNNNNESSPTLFHSPTSAAE